MTRPISNVMPRVQTPNSEDFYASGGMLEENIASRFPDSPPYHFATERADQRDIFL